jgi:hypothetical protein
MSEAAEIVRLRHQLLGEQEAHRKTKQTVSGLKSAVARLQAIALHQRLELQALKLEAGASTAEDEARVA